MYFLLSFDSEAKASHIVAGPFTTIAEANKELIEEIKDKASVSEKTIKYAEKSYDEIEAGEKYIFFRSEEGGYIREIDKYTYYTIEETDCFSINEETLEGMFRHYIEKKKYNQARNSDSQNGLYSAGECEEAEKWLELFGVDLNYFRIQQMVEGKIPVSPFANRYILHYFRGRKDSGSCEIFSSLKRDEFIDEDDFLEALMEEGAITAAFANDVVSIDDAD